MKPRIPTPPPGKWHSTTGHYDRKKNKQETEEAIVESESDIEEASEESKGNDQGKEIQLLSERGIKKQRDRSR